MSTSRPEDFIFNSDYATIANDGGPETASITFPGGTAITATGTYSSTQDIVIGQSNAALRSSIRSSKESSTRYVCFTMTVLRNATLSDTTPASVQVVATVARISATTLRFTVMANNPYGLNLTTEAGDETFTLSVNTFVSPFNQA